MNPPRARPSRATALIRRSLTGPDHGRGSARASDRGAVSPDPGRRPACDGPSARPAGPTPAWTSAPVQPDGPAEDPSVHRAGPASATFPNARPIHRRRQRSRGRMIGCHRSAGRPSGPNLTEKTRPLTLPPTLYRSSEGPLRGILFADDPRLGRVGCCQSASVDEIHKTVARSLPAPAVIRVRVTSTELKRWI